MEGNQIVDEVCEREGIKILGEVGERGEVDTVEDQKYTWKTKARRCRRMAVSKQRRLIQLLSDAGANEFNPELQSADPCQSAEAQQRQSSE